MKRYLFLFATIITSLGYGDAGARPEPPEGPWFTGPLLTPSASTVPQGHVNIEPYVFVNRKTGNYEADWGSNSEGKSTSVTLQVPIQVGLTSFMDFQTFPYGTYNNVQGHTGIRFGDLPVQVNFQIYREQPDSAIPHIKISLTEDFPTGKFDHLNPNKLGADASGMGSYITTVGLTIGKLFHFGGSHYLRFRTNFSYSVPSAVHVEGFNVYGGGFGTNGKAYPGKEFSTLIGLEYTPILRLAFALDIFGVTTEKVRFSGNAGKVPNPTTERPTDIDLPPFIDASVGAHSSEQVSLAPAVEYNFTETIGLIGGVWFSIAGRNSARFINGVVALNMYF